MPELDNAMAGKVCLVTGSTKGIGEATARALAGRGATVCIVGRSPEGCDATARRIRDQTGNPAVDFLAADLSSQSDVRRLADKFQGRYPRLDVLVNNAGAMFVARRESVDGIEMTFALNHLAYFLLTNLLLDRLKASAPSRVICVASDAHRQAKRFDFDDLQGRNRYGALRAYSQSKLANVLFTFELARRLEGSGVTVNALHPGFVATQFFATDGMKGMMARLIQLGARLFAIGPEEGATTSIHLAASPDLEGITGRYFVKRESVPPSEAARDEAAARRLWEISEEMTGLRAQGRA